MERRSQAGSPAADDWYREAAPCWWPSPEQGEASRLYRFYRGLGFAEYPDFLRWSRDEPAAFWEAVVRDLDLRFLSPYRQVLDLSEGPEFPRWFRGGRYNYVVNALDRWVERDPERVCLRWEGDDGARRAWTRRQLAEETGRVAAGLTALGLGKGDRVGILLPMIPETAAATLAVNRLGAAYVPIFSGFGPEAVAERLRDAGARFLITADGCLRRGRKVPLKQTADAAAAACPSLERIVVVPRLGESVPMTEGRDVSWNALPVGPAPGPEPTDPEDLCLLIHTSGTTGRPKGAVHPHCGFPLKATQDMAHLFDVGEADTLLWYTDLGWMMGPWAIMGALTLGACLALYEGTPDHPHPGRIWEVAEALQATVLGIAPTAIRALMAHGDEWPGRFDLSRLRILGSSGEPWNPGPWHWFLERVGGGRCPLINYSGGTEISGGILGCVPFLPLVPCGFNSVVPGMGAEVRDEEGRRVRDQVGELTVTGVWPGMTRGFWNDRERYLETYWSRWPGVWVHGDFAVERSDGHWFILGRSDDTLKVAGKRVGPAEVESAACAHPAVREAAAIGAPDEVKGEVVVLFVVPAGEPTEADREGIADRVASVLGKPLRPSRVLFVRQLPKTRNAKVLRRLIRSVYLGLPPGDLASLEDPAALEAIRQAT